MLGGDDAAGADYISDEVARRHLAEAFTFLSLLKQR